MRVSSGLLLFLAIAAAAVGGWTFVHANNSANSSVLNEIEALILSVTSTILFSGAAIVQAISRGNEAQAPAASPTQKERLPDDRGRFGGYDPLASVQGCQK